MRPEPAKVEMRVVRPKEMNERRTVSVVTSTTPLAAISRATSASSWLPCSTESTPPATATRTPASSPTCAATLAPRAWTASVTRPHLAQRPRRARRVARVEVDLHQVGAVVELPDRQRQQLVAVARLDPDAGRQGAGPRHPGPRGADRRELRAVLAIGRGRRSPGHGAGRPPDRRRPASRRRAASGCRRSRRGGRSPPRTPQPLRRVGEAVEPSRPAGAGDVAVRIDHPRHDRGAGRVDHLRVARVLLPVDRADPADDARRPPAR